MKQYNIASGIIRDKQDRILLVKNLYDKDAFWTLPGGVVEKNENFIEGLKREILEETGLKIKSIQNIAYSLQYTDHEKSFQDLVFVFETNHFEGILNPNDPDKEVLEAHWFTPKETLKEFKKHPLFNIREPFIDYLSNGEKHFFVLEKKEESEQPFIKDTL